MADVKISALPAAAGVTADDLFAIVDNPGGAAVTQKATAAQLRTFIGCQIYQGRAPAAPDDPALPALDYPLGGGSIQQWNIATAQWL